MESKGKIRVGELIREAEGGMKEHYISLIEGLLGTGLEVVALCNLTARDRKKLQSLGATVIPFAIKGRFRPTRDILAIFRLSRKLKGAGIQILHCHGFRAGFIGRMAAIFVPCPCIYTIHNFLPLELKKGGRILAKLTEGILSKVSGTVITVSNALKEEVTRALGIRTNRIRVIYNGIQPPNILKAERDLAIRDLREKWGIGEDERVIGTVARLIPSKGIEVLIDTIPRVLAGFPKAKFMVLGDGPIRERLRERARELNCEENIIFTGHREYIWYYYEIFDIFVLPSLSEGLGISILEAMAMGKPVIATKVGGIPEIIEHGRNGYLIEPGNRDELTEAILYFLAHSEVAREYGDRGKLTIGDKFSPHTMIADTLEVIEELMEG